MSTGNPYNEAYAAQKLREAYYQGKRDGYKDAVKQIELATREIKKAKRMSERNRTPLPFTTEEDA